MPEWLKEVELIAVLVSSQDVEVTESGRVIRRPALQNNNPKMHRSPQTLTQIHLSESTRIIYRRRVEESHDYANVEGLREDGASARLVVSSAAGDR